MIARLRSSWSRQWAFRVTATGLAVAGFVLLGNTLAHPYKSVSDQNSRSFARFYWTESARDSELACVKSDLGLGFSQRNWTLFKSALYLCNQKIYSPRHREGVGVNWNMASTDGPLRCVLYNECPENNPACSAWLAEMTEQFELSNRRSFVVNESSHRDDETDVEDRYTIHDFVPGRVEPARRIVRDASPRNASSFLTVPARNLRHVDGGRRSRGAGAGGREARRPNLYFTPFHGIPTIRHVR